MSAGESVCLGVLVRIRNCSVLGDVRRPKKKMENRTNNMNGRELTDEQEVPKRWTQYSKELLNVMEDRDEELSTRLRRGGMKVKG